MQESNINIDFNFLFSGIKVTIICPCTEKHILKYSSQEVRIIQETPEIYDAITKPRVDLESEQFTLNVRQAPSIFSRLFNNNIYC